MALIAVFDTGPLGVATKARGKPDRDQLRLWIDDVVGAGGEVLVPGIADYELRRELIRKGLAPSVARLDLFLASVRFEPIDDRVMKRAADLWALVRNVGLPTAGREALDGDCILAAHARLAMRPGDVVIVITENVGHLGRFPGILARRWQDIDPATV